MQTYSSLTTSLALGTFAFTSFLSSPALPAPASPRIPQVARPSTAPVAKAERGYIKALLGINGNLSAAQTAIRRFTPLRGNGPSISLVAAVHIGEKSYYRQIQQFLDKQDLVLYEGVRSSRSAGEGNSARVVGPRNSSVAKKPIGIQKKLSDALNLQYQMDGIHYNRPQFRNSDLDWDALNVLATKAGPNTQRLLSELKNSVSGGPSVTRVDQILDKVLTFSTYTPLVATMLRRLLIRVLCTPDDVQNLTRNAQAKSSTPTFDKTLDSILINERNKAVLADIQAQLKTSKGNSRHSIRSIAVFYGAAHMKDIEQYLISDLGYRPAGAQWITAIQAAH